MIHCKKHGQIDLNYCHSCPDAHEVYDTFWDWLSSLFGSSWTTRCRHNLTAKYGCGR